MSNKLLRAVEEYLEEERAYSRDVEGEVQRLERAIDDVRRDSRAASRVDTLAMVRDVLHARSQDATPPTLADMVEWLDAEIRRGQS